MEATAETHRMFSMSYICCREASKLPPVCVIMGTLCFMNTQAQNNENNNDNNILLVCVIMVTLCFTSTQAHNVWHTWGFE